MCVIHYINFYPYTGICGLLCGKTLLITLLLFLIRNIHDILVKQFAAPSSISKFFSVMQVLQENEQSICWIWNCTYSKLHISFRLHFILVKVEKKGDLNVDFSVNRFSSCQQRHSKAYWIGSWTGIESDNKTNQPLVEIVFDLMLIITLELNLNEQLFNIMYEKIWLTEI